VISLIALLIGFVIDIIIGDPKKIPHPVRFIGILISLFEKFLRTIFPKNKKGEIFAGVFLFFIVVSLSTVLPFFVLLYIGKINIYLRIGIESFMCWQILAIKSLQEESVKVYNELTNNNIENARFNVSMIVGRDTDNLNEIGITKACIETVAENTSDGIVAPMIFCAAGGASFGFLYKAVNTLDSMVGYKNEKYLYLGRFSAYIDDLLNYIPARISALLMMLSSWILRLDFKNAFKIWKRDRRNHASPNSAQTEAVCAGALNIQLAGNAYYNGILYEKPFIGDKFREIEYEDIKKTNKLSFTTAILCLFFILLIKGAIILCF